MATALNRWLDTLLAAAVSNECAYASNDSDAYAPLSSAFTLNHAA